MKKVILWLVVFQIVVPAALSAREVPFTLEDRDRIIRIEARLNEIDKRFEQIDKRFEQMMSFLWILTTVFVAITVMTIGFALWDRKTVLKPLEMKVESNATKLENALNALRKLAEIDKKVYVILKQFNLL